MKTFSQHLFRSLFPGLLLVILGSGILLQILIARSLTSEFDRALFSKAESLMAITEQDEDGVEVEVYPDALASYFAKTNPDYFEIYTLSGERLFYSDSLRSDQQLKTENDLSDRIFDQPLPDGRKGRYIQKTYFPKIDVEDDEEEYVRATQQTATSGGAFAPSGKLLVINGVPIQPERVHVTVAASRENLDDRISQFNWILLLSGVVTISVVTLLQHAAIRRSVRPIEQFSKNIDRLDVGIIEKNLEVDHSIKEIHMLTSRFNGLMDRLHDSFKRERQFSADLAHEIRTPLAELRTLVEVHHRFPSDHALSATFNDDVIESVRRMESLTQNLMALSRGDSGLIERSGTIDLGQLITRTIENMDVSIEESRRTLNLSLCDQVVQVEGGDCWPRIVENLFDNAIEHSPEKSIIQISLSDVTENNEYEFVVENAAPDLEKDDLGHIYDRLWRKDPSRSSNRHSGLGLSLVKMYIQFVNATITATIEDGNRLRLTINGNMCADQEEPS